MRSRDHSVLQLRLFTTSLYLQHVFDTIDRVDQTTHKRLRAHLNEQIFYTAIVIFPNLITSKIHESIFEDSAGCRIMHICVYQCDCYVLLSFNGLQCTVCVCVVLGKTQ